VVFTEDVKDYYEELKEHNVSFEDIKVKMSDGTPILLAC